MAAVLCVNGREYVGLNSRKTHPLQARFSKHVQAIHQHAEIAAVVKALRVHPVADLSSAKLFVARVYPNGSTGTAQPCAGCTRMIQAFNIKQVEWTT